jgi:NAD(P)-dependent dehydrogenase (short-subunit alcohol dehydrogenase family)
VDILINVAGTLGPAGEFHTNNLSAWKKVIDVNLFGAANMCHAVLPYMVKQKSGKIVNFSGGGAVQPFPNFSGYSVSKTGVVRLTENLAVEYRKYNIQVNAVAPGIINSKFLTDALKAGEKRTGKDYYQKVLKQKQSGGDSPDLAAELVSFLTSSKNKLTGKLIAAKWDSWQNLSAGEISRLNKSSLYALRRIDNKYFRAV